MEKGWPATVMEPERAVESLAATWVVTVPLPFPEAPLVMVTHRSELEAVHEQPGEVVTLIVPVPPAPETDRLVGLIARGCRKSHAADAGWIFVRSAAAVLLSRVPPDTVTWLLACEGAPESMLMETYIGG
jgi:hypothetical protein